MKRTALLCSILFALSLGSAARANTLSTGNSFYATCPESKTASEGGVLAVCVAYVLGIQDALSMASYGISMPEDKETGVDLQTQLGLPQSAVTLDPPLGWYCLDDYTGNQLLDVLLAYLAKNPAERSHPTVGLFFNAMKEAFPCPKIKGSK